MLTIDKLSYLSKLRYTNPAEKFFYSLLTLIFCIVSRSITIGLLVLVVNFILTVKFGGISYKRYLKLMFIPMSFLILSTLAIFLNISKKPLDLYSLPIGSFYLTGSREGFSRAVSLVITALASVSSLYFLSLNTTMTDLFSVMRKFKVPGLFIELMLLIYRYIFVLLDTAHSISVSQDSRLGNKDYKTSLKSFSQMVSALFVRSVKRSRYLFDAMEARGYDGEIKVLEEHRPINKRTVFKIVIFEMFLLILTLLIKIKGVHLI